MAALFDPRTVEREFRRRAWLAMLMMFACMCIYESIRSAIVLSKGERVELEHDSEWGTWPATRVCKVLQGDEALEWAFYSINCPPKPDMLHECKNPENDWKVVTKGPGEGWLEGRHCIEFQPEAHFAPKLEGGLTHRRFELYFHVSFRMNNTAQSKASQLREINLKKSFEFSAFHAGDFAGFFADLNPSPLYDEFVLNDVTLVKHKMLTLRHSKWLPFLTDATTSFRASTTEYKRMQGSFPRKAVNESISHGISANDERLSRVAWKLRLESVGAAPPNFYPLVRVFREQPRFMIISLGEIGGLLTLIGCVLRCWFPLKYPKAYAVATNHLRTQRGHQNRGTNVRATARDGYAAGATFKESASSFLHRVFGPNEGTEELSRYASSDHDAMSQFTYDLETHRRGPYAVSPLTSAPPSLSRDKKTVTWANEDAQHVEMSVSGPPLTSEHNSA